MCCRTVNETHPWESCDPPTPDPATGRSTEDEDEGLHGTHYTTLYSRDNLHCEMKACQKHEPSDRIIVETEFFKPHLVYTGSSV